MYRLKVMYLFLLLSIIPVTLLATTYENATDRKTKGWHVIKQFSKGVVKNVYDKKKRSRVIRLDGNGTRSVYMFQPKKGVFKRKKEERVLEWEMNYSEDFVIMVAIDTLKGKRFLIYTSGDKNSYLQYGLGVDSRFGEWKKYQRDLQRDLETFDHYNKFLNITNFVVKGSGMFDNIKMVKSKEKLPPSLSTIKSEANNSIEHNSIKESIDNKKRIEREKSKESSPPTIVIQGKNPLLLKKGEAYVEAGAIARNSDGSPINITISDDIDILKEGEYSVIYMATNSVGDSVIDRRRVIVGEPLEEKRLTQRELLENKEEAEVLSENSIDLEQRALEMLEWEKELVIREQELLERKKSREDKPFNPNYPLRPGL